MNKLLTLLFIPLLSFSQIVTEDCNSIPDPGNCLAAFQIYYFNQSTGLCEESLWGGCDGLVPFWTLEECQNSCENIEIGGCMDATACNYNELATEDWGNCVYPGDSLCIADATFPQPGVMLCTWNEICEEDCVLIEDEEDCFNTSIEEMPTNKNLLKTIDLLGREVTKKGFQLEIFDDGSVNKKYLLK